MKWKIASEPFYVITTLPLLAAGLITMYSFDTGSYYFARQLLWIGAGLLLFTGASLIDWRFLRRPEVLLFLYGGTLGLLLLLFLFGSVVRGSQSWFSAGGIAFQPGDVMKLVLIVMLAKYFSRRHVEIAHAKHIFVSGIYAFVPFVLILLQPDFGTAVILFCIWFGMTLASGISKKHLLIVASCGAAAFFMLWTFGFTDIQKARILTFLHPLADVRGTGYNAYQSTIAVGSGELLGKGIGYGTQSRLAFLPEYETDFIFAAFAEEWGFIGVLFLFALFALLFGRILYDSYYGDSNFEILYGIGLFVFLFSHFIIHIGMNIGMLPVTGLTLPFLSYGGSHLLVEFLGLGILAGMARYSRTAHKDAILKGELLGVTPYDR
jgi:rod shape determining protein RodA